MLFIIIMDVLNSLFIKAGDEGLLQPLSNRNIQQRISLYADDVVLFIRPTEEELQITKEILDCFGNASGLQTNLQKSCVIPIRCEEALGVVGENLQCPVTEFPTTYLGLPISNKKLRKSDLVSWLEKIADRLPGWKASFMNLTGRATMVRTVLSAIPVYLLIAMNVPKWVIKAIDKICRAFLWKGGKEVNGGSCLVAWDKVTRPLDLGGLGIHNLQVMSWALQMRWLWLRVRLVARMGFCRLASYIPDEGK
uniref:Reverse transcriptase domain-containing protein n=1 Tax=Arundo donax TaxID=35708 RepID=A0A0A8ZUL3_ARUDO